MSIGNITYEEEFDSVTEWQASEGAHQRAAATRHGDSRKGQKKRRSRHKSEVGQMHAEKSLYDALGGDMEELRRYHKEVMRVVKVHRYDLDGEETSDLAWDLLNESSVYLSRQPSGFKGGEHYNNGARLLKQARRLLNRPTPLSADTVEQHPEMLHELDRKFRKVEDTGPEAVTSTADTGKDTSGSKQRNRRELAASEDYGRSRGFEPPGSDAHLAAMMAGMSVEDHREAKHSNREWLGKRLAAERGGNLSTRGPVRKPDSEVSSRTLRRRANAAGQARKPGRPRKGL